MSLFSLQGRIHVGTRLVSGKPGPLSWVGNVPEATLALATETTPKTESFSGQRLSYGRLQTSKSGTFNLTLDEWSLKNLAMGLYSASANTATGTVTDEAFPSALVAGDQIRLEHPYASALVIEDSASGTPATLTAGTHYRLMGHNASMIELLDVASLTQPFLASYSYAAYDQIGAFSVASPERYVVFDGVNTETGEGVLIDVYRVRFDPISELGLIHQEYGSLSLAGSLLFDELNNSGGQEAGFFRIRQKAPTP